MFYPRLKMARNLLSDDGVIFISIDDNEQAGLKFVCNEIFGESNFVAQLVWQRAFAPKNDAKHVSVSHDYVLMYASNIQAFKIGRLARTEEANARYSNPDNDPRGVWMSSDISVKTYNADNRIWFGPNGDGVPALKRFMPELKHEGIAPVSILYYKDAGHNQEGAQEVAKLLGGGYFNGPKPVRLLRHLMTLANLKRQPMDGGSRKFIMIQLPEQCSQSSEAFKAGYHNICEIGRERILRAGNGLIGDTGFRVFRVDSTNYRDVYHTPEKLTQDMLDDLIENIKPDRTGLDLLYGIIAELGLPLSLKYSREEVDGFTVHYYGEGKITACFDSGIDEQLVKFIAGKRPAIALFRDSCFEDSNVMINLEQFFRFYAPDSEIKIL
ncbi:MAG: site-specific DNA-methyltransferase [Synergistaceae bacterium]|nr:site-specific DNA-methyltransferase [Synergistaceae bacterium]